MRISDWSSDVCSSDLATVDGYSCVGTEVRGCRRRSAGASRRSPAARRRPRSARAAPAAADGRNGQDDRATTAPAWKRAAACRRERETRGSRSETKPHKQPQTATPTAAGRGTREPEKNRRTTETGGGKKRDRKGKE